MDYIPTTLDVRSVPKCTPKAFGIRFEITLQGCPKKMFGPRGKRLYIWKMSQRVKDEIIRAYWGLTYVFLCYDCKYFMINLLFVAWSKTIMFVYTGVCRQHITVQYQWWMQRWRYSDFCWCWCWCSWWRRNVNDDNNDDDDDDMMMVMKMILMKTVNHKNNWPMPVPVLVITTSKVSIRRRLASSIWRNQPNRHLSYSVLLEFQIYDPYLSWILLIQL